jgi:hypothetical protein
MGKAPAGRFADYDALIAALRAPPGPARAVRLQDPRAAVTIDMIPLLGGRLLPRPLVALGGRGLLHRRRHKLAGQTLGKRPYAQAEGHRRCAGAPSSWRTAVQRLRRLRLGPDRPGPCYGLPRLLSSHRPRIGFSFSRSGLPHHSRQLVESAPFLRGVSAVIFVGLPWPLPVRPPSTPRKLALHDRPVHEPRSATPGGAILGTGWPRFLKATPGFACRAWAEGELCSPGEPSAGRRVPLRVPAETRGRRRASLRRKPVYPPRRGGIGTL